MWRALLELALRLLAWLTAPKKPKAVEGPHVRVLQEAAERARTARLEELDAEIADARGPRDAAGVLRDITGADRTEAQ